MHLLIILQISVAVLVIISKQIKRLSSLKVVIHFIMQSIVLTRTF